MSIVVLWISITAFTILTAGSLSAWRSASLGKTSQLTSYAALLTGYGLWLVLYTFIFFSHLFVSSLDPGMILIFGGLRMIFTIIILLCYLSMTLQDLKIGSWEPDAGHLRIITIAAPTGYLLFMLLNLNTMTIEKASVVTIIFSLVNLGASAAGYASASYQGKPRFRHLFLIIAVYSMISCILAFPPILSIDSPLIHALPRALLCAALGLSELIYFFVSTSAKEQEITREFIETYHITRREQEVLSLLNKGYQVKKIAELLYISPRTVETHISNIYAKTRSSSRLELTTLLRTFRVTASK